LVAAIAEARILAGDPQQGHAILDETRHTYSRFYAFTRDLDKIVRRCSWVALASRSDSFAMSILYSLPSTRSSIVVPEKVTPWTSCASSIPLLLELVPL
jgi:hypothetical protein